MAGKADKAAELSLKVMAQDCPSCSPIIPFKFRTITSGNSIQPPAGTDVNNTYNLLSIYYIQRSVEILNLQNHALKIIFNG